MSTGRRVFAEYFRLEGKFSCSDAWQALPGGLGHGERDKGTEEEIEAGFHGIW
jgi:hypothetical protein